MPEYLSPGVYVEEVETGAMTIEGVSTSTAGFLGQTERGPVEPQFVGSFAEFKRTYGGFSKYRRGEPLDGTNLAYAVQGFFNNGGSRCYVGRITAAEETGDVGLGRYSPPMALEAGPTAVEFDTVVVGRTVTETVELEHAGFENDPPIEVSSVTTEASEASDTPEFFTARLGSGRSTPYTLSAGDSVVVEVTYRPGGAGSHRATLSVGHDGADPPLEVQLTGDGQEADEAANFVYEPDAFDFGTVGLNTAVTESVTVRNDGIEGAEPIVITDVGLVPNGGDVSPFEIDNQDDFSSDVTLGIDDRATIDVEIVHGTAEAVLAGVEIEYSIGSNDESEVVDVRGDVVDPANTLGADAKEVDFGEVITETTAERTLVLRNMGTTTVTVDDVTVSDPTEFGATLTVISSGDDLEGGATTPLRLTYSPSSAGAPPDQTVTVEYTDGDGNEKDRTITVGGEGVDVGGEYTSRPTAEAGLQYDDVVLGESETRTVVVTNAAQAGATDVVIADVEIDDDPEDEFSLPEDLVPDSAPPVATIPPGESFEIPVTVTPEDIGPVDAELVIDYDNGTSGTDTFQLTGTVVEPMVGFRAVGPGDWGGRVAVTVRNGARSNDAFDVTVRYWSDLDPADGGDHEVVAAQDDPDVEERFTDLRTDQSSSDYYETVIESGSNLVEVDRLGPDRPANGTWFLEVPPPDPDAPDEVGLSHYTGSSEEPRGERTGLAGFAEVDDISIVTVPDENAFDGLTGEIVTHCERLADRFAVLQAPQGADPGDLPPGTAISEYAAYYYPNIRIVDPETGLRRLVPPGGHVAGIYARSDADYGVWKAPANETVRGAVDLEFPVTKSDQDRLNPKGVNAIRSFPGRGIRVWGARTTSANPQWKYVNVRRLFLYIEESIDEGTQWAVFESNTEKLWARVRQSVRNFLTTVWREGGLAGSSPEEAFYVRADRTTMTQADIDQGKLIIEIGVAPVKPAEFVIFRITQWTEGVEGGS